MIAVQSENISPIVTAWRERTEVKEPTGGRTIASAIMVESPFNGILLIKAMNDSGGMGVTVSDHQIHEGIRKLGAEGIFAEPASAAAIAALRRSTIGRMKRSSS